MKLLVTTDFSANSNGAIRFAQSLARQSKNVDVVFYHAIHMMKPTRWSDAFYKAYKEGETARITAELQKFVQANIGKSNTGFTSVKFVVDNCISTVKDIIEYAQRKRMDFICIATQGAGMLRKIMGTHTSYIVNNSRVPVLVIPSHYRNKTIKSATYLSDFENLKRELTRVSKLTTAFSLELEVLHYSSVVFDQKRFDKNKELFSTKEYSHIKLNIQKSHLEHSLVERVSKYVRNSKPELLIMFTQREKSFLESIFLPSKSAELTFSTKVPILIYSK